MLIFFVCSYFSYNYLLKRQFATFQQSTNALLAESLTLHKRARITVYYWLLWDGGTALLLLITDT